jgi:hypothetical protein
MGPEGPLCHCNLASVGIWLSSTPDVRLRQYGVGLATITLRFENTSVVYVSLRPREYRIRCTTVDCVWGEQA